MRVPINMRYSLKIKDNQSQFKRNMLESIQQDIAKKFRINGGPIKKKVADIVVDAVSQSPEFISLGVFAEGELAPEFGFYPGKGVQIALLTAIRASLKINVRTPNIKSARKPQNLITIAIDRDALLNDPVGSYVSRVIRYGGRKSGSRAVYRVNWLRWLMESGTAPTVMNFQITYDLGMKEQARSRSGLALMIKGGYYSVPAEYAGTAGDNFITRALDASYEQELIKYINRIMRY